MAKQTKVPRFKVRDIRFSGYPYGLRWPEVLELLARGGYAAVPWWPDGAYLWMGRNGVPWLFYPGQGAWQYDVTAFDYAFIDWQELAEPPALRGWVEPAPVNDGWTTPW